MKLIYLSNIRIPTEKAHGIHIAKMCEAFSKKINLTLLIPRRLNSIKESIFDYYNIGKTFKVKKLICLDLIPLNINKIGFWIQTLTFSLSSSIYLLFHKADIIYSRDLPLLFFPSFFKNNLAVELHYLPSNFMLYGRIFKKARLIVVLTKQLKTALIKRGVKKNKIIVCADAVDLRLFRIKESKMDCRKKLDLPQDKNIILSNTSLYPWKGGQTLADASKYLPENCLTVIVGGPPEEVNKFKERNKSLKNLLIAGYHPYEEMPHYLKAADIFVIPNSQKSRASREWTSPMKLFEFMASKRPIVASDLSSLREVLSEKNAIFFRPDNAKDLANKINSVLNDPELSDQISSQARLDIEDYTWDKRVKRIINTLKLCRR